MENEKTPLDREQLTKALDAIKKLKAQLFAQQEPIAIVGMSCRYPGGADTPEKLWQLLELGEHGIIETPKARWDNANYFDPDGTKANKMSTRAAGYLNEDIRLFDKEFFKVTEEEAKALDPQQRLSLEVAWEALENAAIVPASLAKTNTGVYMGVSFNDYMQLLQRSADSSPISKYMISGNQFSVLTGRLAYFFGCEGPAITIDTACSSSLVALHYACQDLRLGNCNMALAGGVNIILSPQSTMGAAKAGMLASDDRCKTLDKKADGFVRGEGCAIIILKRLQDAINDKNRILGTIVGSAVNQNGLSASLTAPNGLAQVRVMQKALSQAKIEAHEVSYLEMHGTGTLLGDLIETCSIAEVYGKGRTQEQALVMTTLKPNIGHTETASGVAGAIKILLALQKNCIPKQINLEEMNPSIKLKDIPAIVPQETRPWLDNKPRIAAVNSFGFSGSNAHVIIKEYLEPSLSKPANGLKRPLHLVPLSAMNEIALRAQAEKLRTFLEKNPTYAIEDIACTLSVGRMHFPTRSYFIVQDTKSLIDKLGDKDFPIFHDVSEKKLKLDFIYSDDDKASESLQKIADHYAKGAAIDWQTCYASSGYQKIALPTYPFQRSYCWYY